MSNHRVIYKRVVSSDGRTIAEAYSEVITSEDCGSTVAQSVTVSVSATAVYSSASSSASCSSNSSRQA